jgi:cytoskeletal protein RodZ
LLERNRVTELPGGIYCRAIVRSYAAEIGLDPEATLRAFLDRHPQEPDVTNTPPHQVEAATPPRQRLLRALASIIGAHIQALAGRAYFSMR